MFSGHYVCPRTHNVCAHALRSHQFIKLKQSDALKSKQMNNLEYKLQQALDTLPKKSSNKQNNDVSSSIPAPTDHTTAANENIPASENLKLHLLETITSNLELQLGLLTSKLDAFMISVMVSSQSSCSEIVNETTKDHCALCDYVTTETSAMETHEKNNHVLSCNMCEFTSVSRDELKTHKKEENPVVVYACDNCDFIRTS